MKNKVEVGEKPIKIPTISMGSFWQDMDDNDILILASVGEHHVALIALNDGNYNVRSVRVKNLHDINETEWSEITGMSSFTRITTPITITPEEG